ncbi:MAG: AzlD family protein [Paracoccaceae bacterium]
MPDFGVLLVVMAGAAFACRMLGFVAMRYLPQSPRLEAALRATPLSVMAGISMLAVLSGGVAEMIALGAVIGFTVLIGSDVAAAFLGVAVVAGLRWMGV